MNTGFEIRKDVGSLKVGDIIRDDILCRVYAINEYSYDEITLHVEDCNGYRYMIRTTTRMATFNVWNWSDEDWAAFQAL